MGKYSDYDPKEKVIFSHSVDNELAAQNTDEYFDEVIEIARSLPQKVYLLVCWKGAKLTPDAIQNYNKRLPELLKHIRGIVRYEADDPVARIVIRSGTVVNNYQKAEAHIYKTKEEALAAVRRLEQEGHSK
jgi:hypothetical protein